MTDRKLTLEERLRLCNNNIDKREWREKAGAGEVLSLEERKERRKLIENKWDSILKKIEEKQGKKQALHGLPTERSPR